MEFEPFLIQLCARRNQIIRAIGLPRQAEFDGKKYVFDLLSQPPKLELDLNAILDAAHHPYPNKHFLRTRLTFNGHQSNGVALGNTFLKLRASN